MKQKLVTLSLAVLIALSSTVQAEYSKRTRQLHDVYCKKCHSAVLYLTKRKLTSRGQVEQQVFSYRGKFPLKEQEMKDLTEYLWLDYYSQPIGGD